MLNSKTGFYGVIIASRCLRFLSINLKPSADFRGCSQVRNICSMWSSGFPCLSRDSSLIFIGPSYFSQCPELETYRFAWPSSVSALSSSLCMKRYVVLNKKQSQWLQQRLPDMSRTIAKKKNIYNTYAHVTLLLHLSLCYLNYTSICNSKSSKGSWCTTNW